MGVPDSGVLTAAMHVASFIGSAGFYLPVLLVVFWCVNPRLGVRAAVVLSLSAALNTMLKVAFHAPRPYWTDPGITAHEPRTSFGMPSGHAQGAAVGWGFAGVLARRRTVWVVVGVVVVLVGVSRVYLGVHSPGQVVAGWAIGALLLVAALRLEPVVVPWWLRRGLWTQMGVSLTVTLAFLTPTAVAVSELSDRRLPEAWARAIEAAGDIAAPVTPTDGVTVAGTLFGVLAGASWLARRGWFEAGGPLWHRALRILVAMAGVAAIWSAGRLASDADVAVLVTHALLGAWVTVGAPEAFVRLGLAGRHTAGVTAASTSTMQRLS